jgi:cytoskeletal protein CcmA (bactofilin family)
VIFSGGLRIDRDVRGSIVAEDGKAGMLVVSERAYIEGESARLTWLSLGRCGLVTSTEYVELQAKANVTGDVYYNTLEMQVGAVV